MDAERDFPGPRLESPVMALDGQVLFCHAILVLDRRVDAEGIENHNGVEPDGLGDRFRLPLYTSKNSGPGCWRTRGDPGCWRTRGILSLPEKGVLHHHKIPSGLQISGAALASHLREFPLMNREREQVREFQGERKREGVKTKFNGTRILIIIQTVLAICFLSFDDLFVAHGDQF